MNKKFSTLLMAGMLVAGSSFNVNAADIKVNGAPLKVQSFGGTKTDVFIVKDADGDGKISSADYLLKATKTKAGKLAYSVVYLATEDLSSLTDKDLDALLWDFKEDIITEGGSGTPGAAAGTKHYYYSLESKATEVPLAFKVNVNPFACVDDADESKFDNGNTQIWFMKEMDDSKIQIKSTDKNTKLWLYYADAGTYGGNQLLTGDGFTMGGPSDSDKFFLATLGERDILGENVAEELNDMKGGKGFMFSFVNSYNGKDINDNIFKDLDLKAFYVDENLDSDGNEDNTEAFMPTDSLGWTANGAHYAIPAGIYLASDWSALDRKDADDKATLNTFRITSKEQFNKMTFVAIHPQSYTKLTDAGRSSGGGFLLKTVKGSDMNFYDEKGVNRLEVENNKDLKNTALMSKAGEVFVGNACFTATVKNPLTENDQYELTVADARLDVAKNGTHANKPITVTVRTSTNNVNDPAGDPYLMSGVGSDVVALKAVPSTTLADVTSLLHNDATPAIYAIKFVSGAEEAANEEVSEYGQYLTVMSRNKQTNQPNNFTFAAMPSVNDGANENDPLYQFVITGVKDNDNDPAHKRETVKITNRLTGASVWAVLYAEKKLGDDIYTVYPSVKEGLSRDQQLRIAHTAANGDFEWKDLDLRGMQVQLIEKKDVKKFDTFETAESEEGLFTFEFAKTAEANDRLYAAAARDKKTGKIEIFNNGSRDEVVTSKTADQFELIRVKENGNDKKDKVSYILNDFVYVQNNNVVTSPIEKDTVAFYTYNIRFFAPDEDQEYYLGYDDINNKGSFVTNKTEYIIKYNLDGSVSLVEKNVNTAANSDFRSAIKYLAVADDVQDDQTEETEKVDVVAWSQALYYNYENDYNKLPVKTFLVPEKVYGSLEALPQTTEFKNTDNYGGYLFMKDEFAAVVNPFETMTFRLDTVDTDKNIPSFYIRTEDKAKFLYFATDSADSKRVADWRKYTFAKDNEDYATRLIFKDASIASLQDADTLQTMVDGKLTKVAVKENKVTGVKGGLNKFKFQVIESGDGDGTYVIRNVAERAYVISVNGNLTLGAEIKAAARFAVDPTIATANESINASGIQVIATNGAVIVKGAAGKTVTISNVLGQKVASTVVTSDEAQIAAPQGVVVVAVEGEAAVKAIVK
ncbi:DUF6383 domain-containing protein [Parabacteroides sp. AM58-2XD]|uniref:DUF6383 domain-containing protein n=1 Tax=Parabacteroides sp. AM58-2XD TaxID=2292362 RepID=UPI000FE24F0F|nr:DUF6383 domain-containing protein [Parabacteroides sp. AM58-2XD]